MKILSNFKYPKLTIMIVLTVLAYFLFSNNQVQNLVSGLKDLTYIGIFIAGVCFSFGFSTPFAVGFFLVSSPENIFIASFVGGLGAMVSDLTIFKFIRFSMMEEFNRLKNTSPIKEIRKELERDFKKKVRNYVLYFLAGIIIASPLPDEIGVSMLAGLTHINPRIFIVISFIMNTVGIMTMLLIGSVI